MTIDKCYEELVHRLNREGIWTKTIAELRECQTNSDRVFFLYELLNEKGEIPVFKTVDKSSTISTKYRNKGNESFNKSKYYEAWQYYNLALLHAPKDTEEYVLSISNRSATMYELERYKECLNDINTVLEMNYPKRIKAKLIERKKLCEDTEEYDEYESYDDPRIKKILSMSSPTHEHIPCASTKLEIAYSPEMGRHVIAKEDIFVGEVLIEEKPYVPILVFKQFLFCCQTCLIRTGNLIPCDKCCYCLYCSEDCKTAAWKSYHYVECVLMPTLITHDFTKLEMLALRTVIKARSDHKDWESLLNTIEEADAKIGTERHGFTKIDDKWTYDSQNYNSVYCLSSNVEKRSIEDKFQKATTAAVFFHYLKEHTDFLKDILDKDNLLRCVAGLLLHHDMTTPINMHNVGATIGLKDMYLGKSPIAGGEFPFSSLMNHSCAPNVQRFTKQGSSVLTICALRFIKKGMQLFDNYGPHYAMANKVERHRQLMRQYYFTCECDACVNNWPTMYNLEYLSPFSQSNYVLHQSQVLLTTFNEYKLLDADLHCALKLYDDLCKLASTLEPYIPCKNIMKCHQFLQLCLATFNGVLPNGFGVPVKWN